MCLRYDSRYIPVERFSKEDSPDTSDQINEYIKVRTK